MHPHEKRALDIAKKQGFKFKDHYKIAKLDDFTHLPEIYSTRAKAEKALSKMKDESKYTIAQVRETIPPVS